MIYATKCKHTDRKHVANGMCGSCNTIKSVKKRGGYAVVGAAWRKANPDRAKYHSRKGGLKTRYGIDADEYERLWYLQEGKCANKACDVSKELYPEKFRALNVDHDHITGKIRGLLCMNCNVALGNATDSIDKLRGLVEYLKEAMN